MKILIDFDGTLLDNHALFYSHIYIYPHIKGFSITSNEEVQLFGLPLYEVGEYYKKYYLENLRVERIIEEMNSLLLYAYNKYSKLRKGSLDLIRFLKNNNHELFICSDSNKDSVLNILERLDICEYFELIDINRDCLKSQAGYWELVVNKYNLKRNQIILIDDSLENIINAKQNLIRCIGCRNFPFNKKYEKNLKKYSDLYIEYFDLSNFIKIENIIRGIEIE